ncbi:hypothetical protein [Ketogulonicigenium vulgare]|uniref:hypothetical protein n=1 Tax=Ketogulonicigenium vulgare TaxID=92945 RepID=UPI0006742254|nr:hypothetical protein [Ketogulonicigenium vulgare]
MVFAWRITTSPAGGADNHLAGGGRGQAAIGAVEQAVAHQIFDLLYGFAGARLAHANGGGGLF